MADKVLSLDVVSIVDVETKGRVSVPKRMNFRKSDPPPNYIANFSGKKPVKGQKSAI